MPPIETTYLWSKQTSSQHAALWDERLYGNVNAIVEEQFEGDTLEIKVFFKSKPEAQEFERLYGGGVRTVCPTDLLIPQDQSDQPLYIEGRKILLCSASDSNVIKNLKQEHPDSIVLHIPAEMAFGTGDHPTSANCLRYLIRFSDTHKGAWSAVDVGCGTGLLAIASSHLGAAHVDAFDFDAEAIIVARRNCQRNLCDSLIPFQEDVFQWTPDNQYDVVMANLYCTVLMQAFPILYNALNPNGVLILSGILKSQWEETKQAGEKVGFRIEDSILEGKWVTAKARK